MPFPGFGFGSVLSGGWGVGFLMSLPGARPRPAGAPFHSVLLGYNVLAAPGGLDLSPKVFRAALQGRVPIAGLEVTGAADWLRIQQKQ